VNDRHLPEDLAAERAVLGAILVDQDLLATVAPLLSPADFYRDSHRRIYAVMLALGAKQVPADFLTVADRLSASGDLDECGGAAYLASLTDGIPRSANVESYARIVREKAALRRVIQTASDIVAKAYDGETPAAALIDQAGALLFTLGQQRDHAELEHVASIAPRAMAIMERHSQAESHQIVGLETGFTELDRLLGGLQPGQLITLASRPGVGKSALSLNICQAVGEAGKVAAIFSLEMSKEELMLRYLASAGQANARRMMRGTLPEADMQRVSDTYANIGGTGIYIDDTGSPSLFEIRAKCRALARQAGRLDLVVVDYLQLMPGNPKIDRRLQVEEVTRGLKIMAKELTVPVLAVSQLNRASETRKDPRPILADLRESGSVENDSDAVIFIFRQEMYPKCPEDKRGIAEVIIGKNRGGPTASIELIWHQEQTRFANKDSRPLYQEF